MSRETLKNVYVETLRVQCLREEIKTNQNKIKAKEEEEGMVRG